MILSTLIRLRDFGSLKTLLGCTDGNLGAHLLKLEQAEMIQSNKAFIGRKPNTSYTITPKGREEFSKYVAGLAGLLGLRT